MINRTDIHCPSRIVPLNYNFVALRVTGICDAGFVWHEREILRSHMEKTGGAFSDHEHGGTCHICGANAIYMCVFYHVPSNAYIECGEDCARKLDLRADFNRVASFKKNFALWREFQAGKTKAQGLLEEAGIYDAWLLYEQGAPSLPHDARGNLFYEELTIRDIVSKVVKYGSISERQVAFVRGLLDRIPARAAKLEAFQAKRAASQHVGTVGERRTFTATIKAVKEIETAYGLSTFTVLAQGDDTIIWFGRGFGNVGKGDVIVFKGTIKSHDEKNGERQTKVTRCETITVNGEDQKAAMKAMYE
jgi:hypothetical protein